MSKKIKTTIMTLIFILILGVLGCRTLVDSITPSNIDKRAQKYSEVSDEEIGKWESLNDAIEVRKEIIIKIKVIIGVLIFLDITFPLK